MSLCGAEVIGWKPETVDAAFHEIVAGLVAGSLNGTDISGWQPGNPPLTGDAFSIIKASEGVGAPNTNWAAQVDWCLSAGALVGHYHFCNGLNTPQAEAQYFWSIVSQKWQVGQPIALDVEGSFFDHVANPVAWVLACAQELFALSGLVPIIYLDWSHLKNTAYNWQPLVDYNCGLWGAAYNPTGFGDPSPWPFLVIWQNADTNVSGGDSDVLYGDASTFTAYGTPAGATPTGDEVEYKDWSPESKIQHFCDMWGLPGGSGGSNAGLPGAPLIIDRETGQGAWPETHLASLRQRLDQSLGGAISAARDAVTGHVDSALAALPVPQLNLTDAQVQTAAAAIAADLKANLPAPLLQALGSQLLAQPAK
jgi:hypothetical protein